MTDFAEEFIDAFTAEIEDSQRFTERDPSTWRAGGRSSKAWPNKEDPDWWLTNGPELLDKWHQWWTSNSFTIWTTPDGEPGIELDLLVQVTKDVSLRAIIDAVVVDGDGDLLAIDWKSGSMAPKSAMQLGTYAVAMERAYKVRPKYGAYYEARKGDLGPMFDLDVYSVDLVGSWLERGQCIQDQELYVPNPSNLCTACGVREWCLVMGGERASEVPEPSERS